MIFSLLLLAGISVTEQVVKHDPVVIQADDVRFSRIRANPRRVRVVLRAPRWPRRFVLIEEAPCPCGESCECVKCDCNEKSK